MNLKIAIAVAMACASFQASAVDGYKDLQFGMSVEDVLKHQPCSLTEVVSPIPQATAYGCDDLQFGGNATEGVAFFVKGKFLRFAIEVPNEAALSTLDALKKKYGKASRVSSQQEFQRVGTAPGARAFFAFDKNTVVLQFDTLPTLEEAAYLIYTDLSYEQLLGMAQKNAIADDL